MAVFVASASYAQVTTEGREFWLGFMSNLDPANPNGQESPSSLELFVTANQVTKVEVFIFTDGSTRSITVTPGVTEKIIISYNVDNPYAATLTGNIEKKAIRVTSDLPISLYAFNNRSNSADATVILPLSTLGSEYIAQTYFETPPATDDVGFANSPAQLLIVAPEDNTQVEITPSSNIISGSLKGQIDTVTLNSGDIYQLRSYGDLTGTRIKVIDNQSGNCEKVAVFGGNRWTRVTGGQDCSGVVQGTTDWTGGYAGDHLYEQMFPLNTWGKTYIVTPLKRRNNYVYRVVASEDNTVLTVNGQVQSFTLNSGQYKDYVSSSVSVVSSEKPISVIQYSTSVSCDNNSATGDGDPFMIVLSPVDQRLRKITFNTLAATNISSYFLSVVKEIGSDPVELNGSVVSNNLFSPVNNTNFSYAILNLEGDKDYTLSNTSGFVANIYAYGGIESFGYAAGASLENLNFQIKGDDEFISIIDQQACLNANIDFFLNFNLEPGENPIYSVFEWNFGDGETAIGDLVSHTYDSPGFYDVIVIASDGQGSCGNSETVMKTIEILETTAEEIIGPKSVCPDVTEIEYTAIGNAGNEYEWFIEGGSFSGSNIGETIKVNWGPANDEAFLKVLPKNALGCIGDTISFPVKINKRLEPEAPRYENMKVEELAYQEVCDADRFGQKYQISPTNGSVYKWFVEGGRFVETTNASETEVYVDWFEKANGKLWYLESNPLVDECEGYSDTLRVKVFPPLVAATANADVLCFGGATGAVDLNISGGDGTYTVEWDNGKTGPNIASLRTGNYTATVTDGLGCQINVTVTIGQPEALKITSINAQAVSCFQDKNGVAQLTAEGGTGGYTYLWKSNSYEVTTNSPTNSNLPPGQYSVSVIDANGCQVATTFNIDEPPLLQADLESLINDPVCPQASDGTAFIDAKGGTPDYQFYWSNKPNIDDKNASDLSEGDYSVRIVDANGCETNLEIAVTERFPKIFFPTAFSPNNDGENETFRPVADCQVTYYMQIYNKWGQVIFSTETLSEGWDGTYNGQDVPEGKYSYLVFYAGTLNDVSFEETYRGSFNLIR